MSTVRDLVNDSMRLIGVIASGETPSASELSDSVRSLKRMLQSWSTQGLLIPNDAREVFLTTPGKADYTMGVGGDFATTKPVKVLRINHTIPDVEQVMTDPGSPGDPGDPLADPPVPPTDPVDPTFVTVVKATIETPCEFVPNTSRWADVTLKSTQSTLFTKAYVEDTAPLMTITLWPVPSIQTGVVVYSQKTLDQVVDADTELMLPDGFEDAIVYNLALRLAPEFGKQADALVVQTARETKASVKVRYAKPVFLKSDAIGLTNPRRFNILNGDSR